MHQKSRHMLRRLAASAAILIMPVLLAEKTSPNPARQSVTKIVAQIQRADYEGDRLALQRLYQELTPYADDKELASRVRYWRGFALWRRVLNGFNESVPQPEQDKDLQQAVEEFNLSAAKDPAFVDAKIGAISCLGFLIGLNQQDPARIKDLLTQAAPLSKSAQAAAPDNPRLLWVVGASQWYIPPERGGGQTKAIETYEKGLAEARKQKPPTDLLDPSWGEPELLMSLAGSDLYRTTPDLNAAEQYANSALMLVPYWHYVRDILIKQIEAAKAKTVPTAQQS